jgi:hypothetical protein
MLAPFHVSLLACAMSLTFLGISAYSLSQPEGMIERSYAGAFGGAEPVRAPQAMTTGDASPALDLSKVHLSSHQTATGVAASLGLGDRITLAQREGGIAEYEVIEVRPLLASDAGSPGVGLPHLMMVTAVTTGGRLPVQTIRFLVEPIQAEALAPAKPRAL